MPVVTRSRSKRASRGSGSDTSEGFEKTPRRSARLAAKRSIEESSDEGRQTSMTPSSSTPVKNPGKEPKFSGITLGSDTLETPMQFYVPEHEAESTYSIRQTIRRLSESPLTLKKRKNSNNNNNNNNNNNRNINNNKNNDNNDNDEKSDSDNDEYDNNNSNNNNSNNSVNKIDSIDENDNLSGKNRFSLGSKPSRVPTFNENTQSWDFEPETEVPQLARNLLLFIISVTLVVLAVIYKEELFNMYNQYMPPFPDSVSSTFTNFSESVQNVWTNVVDAVKNAVPSQNDSVVTDANDAAVNTDAGDVMSDSTTETVTNDA